MSNAPDINVSDFIMDLGYLELDDIVGQDEAIDELKNIVDAIENKDIYAMWGYNIPRGILLLGGPGTGKTATVRALAKRLENTVTLMELRYLDIASKWVDMPIEQLRNFFALAEEESKNKHVLIFIDEIDAMIPNREDQLHETSMKRVNVFLEWMDGGFNILKNITIIGATNRKEGIDKAALRPGRFGKIIEYKDLCKKDIIHGIKIHFSKRKIDSGLILDIDWSEVESSTTVKSMTGADLPEIIDKILSIKVKEHISMIRNNIDDKPTISTKDFINIINSYKTNTNNKIKIGYQQHGLSSSV